MILVTGAAGFIGSNFLALWEETGGGHCLAVDSLESEHQRRNVAKRRAVTWVAPADLISYLADSPKDIRAVIHLGAETSTTATDRDAVFETNVTFSTALWQWCAAQTVPFIYASSASVYGDGSGGFGADMSPSAGHTLKPLNLYGESKLAFDNLVMGAIADGSATPPQWAGLRFFNVYGPNEFHKGTQASVVSQMYPVAARGESYRLFRSHRDGVADGEQQRDFIFVDDCVRVILWLLDHSHVSGLFNVGTGSARTFLDLAKAVYAAADQPFTVAWRDTPASLQEHYQYYTQADINGLRQAGYTDAFTSLEDGVTMTIRKYLSASDPYR